MIKQLMCIVLLLTFTFSTEIATAQNNYTNAKNGFSLNVPDGAKIGTHDTNGDDDVTIEFFCAPAMTTINFALTTHTSTTVKPENSINGYANQYKHMFTEPGKPEVTDMQVGGLSARFTKVLGKSEYIMGQTAYLQCLWYDDKQLHQLVTIIEASNVDAVEKDMKKMLVTFKKK
jgi:hypothetical protein